jgi:transmembrane sensor
MEASDPLIRAAITQVAANWYAAHRVGLLSDTARANFLAWLKASPIHIEEYLGVATVERTLAGGDADTDLSVEALVDLARNDLTGGVMDIASPAARYQAHREPPPRRFLFGVAAAACASLLGLVTFWTVRDFHGSGAIKTYRTAHGQQGVWPLPDGSTLHVNTDTTVSVRFTPTERLVDVDHGQIAVEVAHDAHRDFRVHAGATDAVAVGTRFDVWRQPDSTLISVMAGQIAVSVQGATTPAGLRNSLRVSAGQQIRVVGGVLPPAVVPADLRESTAWLERKIIFNERPLGVVAEEFNRYNSLTFTIEDPALRNLPISGAFDATDIDSFAAFLTSLDGVRVDRQPAGFDVSRHSPDPAI